MQDFHKVFSKQIDVTNTVKYKCMQVKNRNDPGSYLRHLPPVWNAWPCDVPVWQTLDRKRHAWLVWQALIKNWRDFITSHVGKVHLAPAYLHIRKFECTLKEMTDSHGSTWTYFGSSLLDVASQHHCAQLQKSHTPNVAVLWIGNL